MFSCLAREKRRGIATKISAILMLHWSNFHPSQAIWNMPDTRSHMTFLALAGLKVPFAQSFQQNGMPKRFLKIERILCNSTSDRPTVHAELSSAFEMTADVRQGCPFYTLIQLRHRVDNDRSMCSFVGTLSDHLVWSFFLKQCVTVEKL